MTDETMREIAHAAIEMMEARLRAADLKYERTEVLVSGCANVVDGFDCYQTMRPQETWCERCRRARTAHLAYKECIKHRTGALIRLKRLVARRDKVLA